MKERPSGRSPRIPARLFVILTVMVLLTALFAGLGTWQLQRRVWKLALIEQVNGRVHAAATPAPGRAAWPTITASHDAYRHVSLTGRFLADHDTLAQAVTVRGSGYWVMTPFLTTRGEIVLVNRGFVTSDRPAPAAPLGGANAAEVTIRGLLRLSEPRGGFLRLNDPVQDRWYSRDVPAIAAARGLSGVAPYFVDADAASSGVNGPVGGLTVIAFTNNHLVYALTWFTLAIMSVGVAVIFVRDHRRALGRRPS